MHPAVFLLWFVAVPVAGAGQAAAPEPDSGAGALVQRLEGRYDNNHQRWYHRNKNNPGAEADLHGHRHVLFKRVLVPALGPYVMVAQHTPGGGAAGASRTELYVFTQPGGAGPIMTERYALPDAGGLALAGGQPPQLSRIEAALEPLSGCTLYWEQEQQEAGRLRAATRAGQCRQRDGNNRLVTVDTRLRLQGDTVYLSETSSQDADLVYAHRNGLSYELRRCTFYRGWILLEDPDSGRYSGRFGLIWHDQGRRIRVLDQDGAPGAYEFELAALTQVRQNLPVLVFKLFEGGNPKAVSYAWVEPGAYRIGLNLRWIQSGLTRTDTYWGPLP